MIFHVHMIVDIPFGLDAKFVDDLKAKERAYSQKLQEEGKWRHIWRIIGQYENISIFDVRDNQELHDLLTGLPLYPFMKIKIQALCRHPSSVKNDDK